MRQYLISEEISKESRLEANGIMLSHVRQTKLCRTWLIFQRFDKL